MPITLSLARRQPRPGLRVFQQPASGHSVISANGRFVAFVSDASTLVPGDNSPYHDIFVRDRQTGQTEQVSLALDGGQTNGDSGRASIDSRGRYVAFDSGAANLVPADTKGWADLFVYDRKTGATVRVSIASDGTEGHQHSCCASISANGKYVVLESHAANLVLEDTNEVPDVFVASNPLYEQPVTCKGLDATIVGTEDDDILNGTDGDDVIAGLGGNDTIRAGAGNDVVCAGAGNDRVIGGPGRDRVYGEGGRDVLRGGPGRDRLYGGPGGDVLKGQGGNDVLNGQGGDDVLVGNRGDDRLLGGGGDDELNCGPGNDVAKGGPGADTAAGCETVSGVP